MMFKKSVIEKLAAAFEMNNAFMAVLADEDLKCRLEGMRASSIGNQLACVARARDAYGKAILADLPFSWSPDFPYDQRYDHEKLSAHLREKSLVFIDELKGFEVFSDNQLDLVLDLLSHEFLHQGQLIRYIYGNGLTMPSGVKGFWHLED
jgi:hypothetical protein